jgi:hypothetical protein
VGLRLTEKQAKIPTNTFKTHFWKIYKIPKSKKGIYPAAQIGLIHAKFSSKPSKMAKNRQIQSQ